MKIYVVTQQGISFQQVGGVYDTEEAAVAAAKQLAEADRDDYHEWDVRLRTMNETTLVHRAPIFTTRKGDTRNDV